MHMGGITNIARLPLLAGLFVSSAALAQDRPSPSPTVLVVGFEDDATDDDCNPVLARYGRCVERVAFTDLSTAWDEDLPSSDKEKPLFRATSSLYAQLWEDLSFRWDEGDVLDSTLRARGVTALPSPGVAWQGTPHPEDEREAFALPARNLWLDAGKWVVGMEDEGFFHTLRYHQASGLLAPPETAILRGRFAQRLAFNGKRHEYEVMDGDPESSGPFFEQMYPYARAMQLDDDSARSGVIPLRRFVIDSNLKAPSSGDRTEDRRFAFQRTLLPSGNWGELYGAASAEFSEFYRLVGTQLLRFAREEYTPTHLRVLSALTAMQTPPGEGGSRTAIRDVVAASQGQTDDQTVHVSPLRSGNFGGKRLFELDYGALPKALVDKYIVLLPEWGNPSRFFLDELYDRILYDLEDYLRKSPSPITSLDPAGVEAWIDENAMPGKKPHITENFTRIGLNLLVFKMRGDERDELEARILLDHVNTDIASRFDATPGIMAAPADQEAQTAEMWAGVLSKHGFYSQPIADGPGAVDPMAICTTKDRKEALSEPVFGAINVDLLLVAPDNVSRTEDVLWYARDQAPFLMIDNPSISKPRAERLVGLPRDQAIYRVRWKVWSGWHLLWAPEPITADGKERRLALRTAALCSDMVLARPDLVPTLARASLLDGDFRPTTPVIGGSTERVEKEVTNDQAVAAGSSGIDATEGAQTQVEATQSMWEGDPAAVIQGVPNSLTFIGGWSKKKQPDVAPITLEAVTYLRELLLAPLRSLADKSPLMVVVFESKRHLESVPTWFFQPRTPYARRQVKTDDGYLSMSSWAQGIGGAEAEASLTMLSPSYLPTELVNTKSVVQKWKRRGTSDWTFAGGVGFAPYVDKRMSCNIASENDVNPSFVRPCRGEVAERFNQMHESFVLDVSALSTNWAIDDRRIAWEIGAEMQLDLNHAGQTWFWADAERNSYPYPGGGTDEETTDIGYRFNYLFRAGVLAGVRFAPDASPLWNSTGGQPWGAPRPDGSSDLGRWQWGLRGGLAVGPGEYGVESTLTGEWWAGWSIRSRTSKQATFTPYHPSILLGPFVRAQYGFVLVPRESTVELPVPYNMKHRVVGAAGLRLQLRLLSKPELKKPEVEAPTLP
jgi:hypothetical protein